MKKGPFKMAGMSFKEESPVKNTDVTEDYRKKGNEATKAHIKAGGTVERDDAGRLTLVKELKKK
jgi:hypothetical protein